MKYVVPSSSIRILLWVLLSALVVPGLALAHDPDFTMDFDRARCTFTTVGTNPYLLLWPGYALHLEGEEEDDEGETVELEVWITVLPETEIVDGVSTRVVEEREQEDGELQEVSRNFFALCRETGDVWYFGEDVMDFEDGEPVPADDGWRAGVNGAQAGIIMPGSPLVGARYFQEQAPGVALDQGEILSVNQQVTVPAGTFDHVLQVADTNAFAPGEVDEKFYAPGVGLIVDEELELVEVMVPPCLPGANTLCLNNGRFRVEADWEDPDGNEGLGFALLPSDDSGEFWFFTPNNTELLVKVIDACDFAGFNSFWVFAAGLTNLEVTIEVTDTATGEQREYDNPQNTPFQPILDTAAFATCP